MGEPRILTEEPKLTDEERARIAELEKSRAISDAELLKGGAEYVVDERGRKRLDVTQDSKILEYANALNKMKDCKNQEEHFNRIKPQLELARKSGSEVIVVYLNPSGNFCEKKYDRYDAQELYITDTDHKHLKCSREEDIHGSLGFAVAIENVVSIKNSFKGAF